MKKFWQWLATALLVAIFLSLANWQWNRAAELKKPLTQDQSVYPIDSLISPNSSIEPTSLGKKVSLEGEYLSNWIAPHQDENKSWVVGLFNHAHLHQQRDCQTAKRVCNQQWPMFDKRNHC